MTSIKEYTKEEAIQILNDLQAQGLIKINNFENLTLSLRAKLDKVVEKIDKDWIDSWTKLWHGKKASVDGYEYYLAQSPADNRLRMEKFISQNGISKEIIWDATLLYLQEMENQNYRYAKKSAKFIQSDDGSVLYGYCARVLYGDTVLKEKATKDFTHDV